MIMLDQNVGAAQPQPTVLGANAQGALGAETITGPDTTVNNRGMAAPQKLKGIIPENAFHVNGVPQPMVEVGVRNWIPNPGVSGGAIRFKQSRTKTPYYRYAGQFFVPLWGRLIDCILMLNAVQVENVAVTERDLEGKSIFVTPLELLIAMENNRREGQAVVVALTNFTSPKDPEIENKRFEMKTRLAIDAQEKMNRQTADAKSAFLANIAFNPSLSPLDPRLQGNTNTSGGVGQFFGNAGDQLVGQTFKQGGEITTATPQTKNPSPEAVRENIAGGGTVAQQVGGDVNLADTANAATRGGADTEGAVNPTSQAQATDPNQI